MDGPFGSCKLKPESTWHVYLNTKDHTLRKAEIKRLEEKLFKLSLALQSSKYGNLFNKLSYLLIDSLAILNRKIDKDVYKAKLSKRVKDAMETTYDDIADDLGNVTDLEDIKADFEDFDVAAIYWQTHPYFRKAKT